MKSKKSRQIELRKAFDALRVSVVRLDGQTATWTFSLQSERTNCLKHCPDAPIFNQLRESQGVFTSEDFLSEPAVSATDIYAWRGNNQCAGVAPCKWRQPA